VHEAPVSLHTWIGLMVMYLSIGTASACPKIPPTIAQPSKAWNAVLTFMVSPFDLLLMFTTVDRPATFRSAIYVPKLDSMDKA
jgi:hypothetical protein